MAHVLDGTPASHLLEQRTLVTAMC